MLAITWLISGVVFLFLSMISVGVVAKEDSARLGKAMVFVLISWGIISLFLSSAISIFIWILSGVTFLVSITTLGSSATDELANSEYFKRVGLRIIVWLVLGLAVVQIFE